MQLQKLNITTSTPSTPLLVSIYAEKLREIQNLSATIPNLEQRLDHLMNADQAAFSSYESFLSWRKDTDLSNFMNDILLRSYIMAAQHIDPDSEELTKKKFNQIFFPSSQWQTLSLADKKIEDKQTPWICYDLKMAAGDSLILVGDSHAGKTYLSAYISLCINYGKPIFNQFKVQQKGTTAYLNFEADYDDFENTLLRLLKGMNCASEGETDIRYEKPLWRLHQNKGYQNLKNICQGAKVCFIDTLRASYDGNENDSKEGRYIALANAVSAETGCQIIFLAHPGKSGVQEGEKGMNSIRGSSAFAAAAGSFWTLSKSGDNVRTVHCAKGRLGRFKPFQYQFDEVGDFLSGIGKSSSIEMKYLGDYAHKEKTLPIRDQILQYLKENEKVNRKTLNENIVGKETNITQELKLLRTEGFVLQEEGPNNSKLLSLTDKMEKGWL